MKISSSQCFPCLNKSGYEEISDGSSPQRRQSSTWGLRSAICVVVGATALFHWRRGARFEGPHETVPTLLSLVDPSTGAFVHAQWNAVYDRLREQTIDFPPSAVLDGLAVDTIAYHSDSRSMWDLQVFSSHHEYHHRGHRHHGRRVGNEWMRQDLFLLQCAQSTEQLEVSPINISNVREAATYEQLKFTTDGSWKVQVPSLRYAYCQWLLVVDTGSTDPFVQVASPILPMPHTTEPANIHLAYAKDPSSLLVHFTSTEPGTPVVQLNHDTIVKENVVTDTYTANDMCQAPANMTGPGQFQSPGYLHTVPLVNLHPSTTYTYQVGLETGQGVTWRQEAMSVTTNAAAGSNSSPYTYVVYGDQGCPLAGWDVGKAWIKGMVERETHVQAIHHFGDLSYAQGAAHQWDAWLDMIEPASSKWPLMVSVGNHEYDYTNQGDVSKDPSGSDAPYEPRWGNYGLDSGGECGVPTAKRFHMPETGNGVFWYSYDSGLVHTIVLSTEHDMNHRSRQRKWLVQDLMAVDRSLTPWVVVEVHRPLYEGEALWAQNNVGIALRMEVENILYDYKVDVVLAGHYHAYHRTCDGLYRDECNRDGPIHLTVGTAGARLDAANVHLLDESWTEKMILQTYGYGRITVHNATTLRFQFVQHGSSDEAAAGKVLDDVWITRDRS